MSDLDLDAILARLEKRRSGTCRYEPGNKNSECAYDEDWHCCIHADRDDMDDDIDALLAEVKQLRGRSGCYSRVFDLMRSSGATTITFAIDENGVEAVTT